MITRWLRKKTRAHVLEIARKHGYSVNRHAQNLRVNRSNTIAVSIDYQSHRSNHVADPFIFELLAGVSEALGKVNQDLLLTSPSHNDLNSLERMVTSRSADGLLFLGQGHREPLLEACYKAGIPMVVWGAKSVQTPYCVVGSDNFRGGQLAAEYFLQQGRRSLLYVGNPEFAESRLRRDGFLQTVQRESEKEAPPISIEEIAPSAFDFDSALAPSSTICHGESCAQMEFLPQAIRLQPLLFGLSLRPD